MRLITHKVWTLSWVLSTFLLFQCSMSGSADRQRSASSTKGTAQGDNSEKTKAEETPEDESKSSNNVEKIQKTSVKTRPAPPPGTDSSEPTTSPASNNSNIAAGTYLVNVTCSDSMEFGVSLGNNAVSRTIKAPKECAQFVTALNGKTFPTGNTVEAALGGPSIKATCDNGTLNFSIVSVQDGTSGDTALIFNLNHNQVCLEIRNIINGLKL